MTRGEIEAIRGVNSDSVVSTLLDRGLIAEAGRKDVVGRPMHYKTTPFFLESFGLRSLDDLPELELEPGQPLEFELGTRRHLHPRVILSPSTTRQDSPSKMRVGLHVRVAGGYAKAVEQPKRWAHRDASILDESAQLSQNAIDVLRSRLSRSFAVRRTLDPCVIHTPYLINLASADPKISQGRWACCSTISQSPRAAA